MRCSQRFTGVELNIPILPILTTRLLSACVKKVSWLSIMKLSRHNNINRDTKLGFFSFKNCQIMCYDLRDLSGTLIMRYSQKKEWISVVFYCFANPSIAHNLGTTGPIQEDLTAKWTAPSDHFNEIQNWKCHMFNFRLILIDHHITYE